MRSCTPQGVLRRSHTTVHERPLVRNEFQSDHACDQRAEENDAPQVRWLLECNDADDDRAHRANAGPHSVCCTDRQGLRGFVQEVHADREAHEEADHPPGGSRSRCFLGLSQTRGKAHFEKASDHQNEPTHLLKVG